MDLGRWLKVQNQGSEPQRRGRGAWRGSWGLLLHSPASGLEPTETLRLIRSHQFYPNPGKLTAVQRRGPKKQPWGRGSKLIKEAASGGPLEHRLLSLSRAQVPGEEAEEGGAGAGPSTRTRLGADGATLGSAPALAGSEAPARCAPARRTFTHPELFSPRGWGPLGPDSSGL